MGYCAHVLNILDEINRSLHHNRLLYLNSILCAIHLQLFKVSGLCCWIMFNEFIIQNGVFSYVSEIILYNNPTANKYQNTTFDSVALRRSIFRKYNSNWNSKKLHFRFCLSSRSNSEQPWQVIYIPSHWTNLIISHFEKQQTLTSDAPCTDPDSDSTKHQQALKRLNFPSLTRFSRTIDSSKCGDSLFFIFLVILLNLFVSATLFSWKNEFPSV